MTMPDQLFSASKIVYKDYFPLEEEPLTQESIQKGYQRPLVLKNETPSCFIVQGGTFNHKPKITLKEISVDSNPIEYPKRQFMDQRQKQDWINELPKNIPTEIPIDFRLHDIIDICIQKEIPIQKACLLIKIVGRDQNDIKQQFECATVFKTMLYQQMEHPNKWNYMLDLSFLLYSESLILQAEFLSSIILLFQKSLKTLPIRLIAMFAEEISKSRYLMTQLIDHIYLKIESLLQKNNEAAKKSLIQLFTLLRNFLEKYPDAFVSRKYNPSIIKKLNVPASQRSKMESRNLWITASSVLKPRPFWRDASLESYISQDWPQNLEVVDYIMNNVNLLYSGCAVLQRIYHKCQSVFHEDLIEYIEKHIEPPYRILQMILGHLHSLESINILQILQRFVGKYEWNRNEKQKYHSFFSGIPIPLAISSSRSSIFYSVAFDEIENTENDELFILKNQLVALLPYPIQCDVSGDKLEPMLESTESAWAMLPASNWPNFLLHLSKQTPYIQSLLAESAEIMLTPYLKYISSGLFARINEILKCNVQVLLRFMLALLQITRNRMVIRQIIVVLKGKSAIWTSMKCNQEIYNAVWKRYQSTQDNGLLAYLSRFLRYEISASNKERLQTELNNQKKIRKLKNIDVQSIIDSSEFELPSMKEIIKKLSNEGRTKAEAKILLESVLKKITSNPTDINIDISTHILWECQINGGNIDHAIVDLLLQKPREVAGWWQFLLQIVCKEICSVSIILEQYILPLIKEKNTSACEFMHILCGKSNDLNMQLDLRSIQCQALTGESVMNILFEIFCCMVELNQISDLNIGPWFLDTVVIKSLPCTQVTQLQVLFHLQFSQPFPTEDQWPEIWEQLTTFEEDVVWTVLHINQQIFKFPIDMNELILNFDIHGLVKDIDFLVDPFYTVLYEKLAESDSNVTTIFMERCTKAIRSLNHSKKLTDLTAHIFKLISEEQVEKRRLLILVKFCGALLPYIQKQADINPVECIQSLLLLLAQKDIHNQTLFEPTFDLTAGLIDTLSTAQQKTLGVWVEEHKGSWARHSEYERRVATLLPFNNEVLILDGLYAHVDGKYQMVNEICSKPWDWIELSSENNGSCIPLQNFGSAIYSNPVPVFKDLYEYGWRPILTNTKDCLDRLNLKRKAEEEDPKILKRRVA